MINLDVEEKKLTSNMFTHFLRLMIILHTSEVASDKIGHWGGSDWIGTDWTGLDWIGLEDALVVALDWWTSNRGLGLGW